MSLQLKMLGKGFVKTNCRSKKGKNRSKSITYWIQQDRAKQWSLFHTSIDPAWSSWSMEGSVNRFGWFMFWYCYENFGLPPKVCEQKYPRSNATETVQPHLEQKHQTSDKWYQIVDIGSIFIAIAIHILVNIIIFKIRGSR